MIVWPAPKPVTLATLIVVAPAADATGRVLASSRPCPGQLSYITLPDSFEK
jgi:hypothetical protein